jgi:hypothetical protein
MKRALLIGINYSSIPSITLNGCIYDIININNVLRDAYDYDNIIILRDDINNPTTMPTRANIINNLLALAKQSSPLDEIWVHYSGHGSQIQDKNNDEVSGKDGILVPIDYKTKGFILDDELLNIIKTFPCKTILIFDCCHSGTVCDLPWSFQYVSPTNTIKTKNNNISITNPNIFMFSGCKDNQKSLDIFVSSDKTAQGAFTNALIQGLRYFRHNVSINQLYQYVCTYLSSNKFTQIPILSASSQTPSYTFTRSIVPSTPVSIVANSSSALIQKNMKSVMITN